DAFLNYLEVEGGDHGNTFTVWNTSPGVQTTLDCGSGGDTVNVQRTTAALTINGNGTFYLGNLLFGTTVVLGTIPNDPFDVPTVANLNGLVTVQGAPGSTTLIVDDSQDSSKTSDGSPHKVMLSASATAGAIQWSAPFAVEIDYDPTALNSLDVKGSDLGNQFTVTGTGAGFPTTIECGAGGDEVDVQATMGPLEIDGQSGLIGSFPILLPVFTT